MNILFLTITKFNSLHARGIYVDLMRKFHSEGHDIYVVAPTERKERKDTFLFKDNRVNILNIKTLNLQKTTLLEKGLGSLLIEYQFLVGIKRYFPKVKFDLVLYSTPPITFFSIISYIKKRDGAYAYLLLKDIFPQNAIDLQILKEGSILHKYFRIKERRLLELSDTIGCMSDANRNYIIDNHPYLSSKKIEVNPNSIEPINFDFDIDRSIIRKKYNIPINAMVFVYGGNLGIPQGLDFLLDTIDCSKNILNIFFLIVGAGTQFTKIKSWFEHNKPQHALLLSRLDKREYDELMKACDVGLIFLNRKFTIPNFPSRLLSYLENRMPVIAATDPNTDIGKIIENYNCGFRVLSGDKEGIINALSKLSSKSSDFEIMRENAWKLLKNEYTVDKSYNLIWNKLRHVADLD